MPLPLELHRPADDIGRAKAGLQFFKETIVETHVFKHPGAAL